MPIEIKEINSTHAEALSQLSKAIYAEHYLHLWYPGGADWYMHEQAYHPAKLLSELSDTNNRHFIVYEDEQPIGYLKIKISATWEGFELFDCLEIERIYLHKRASGKGIGKQLMQLSEQIARETHKDKIFLKAMDSSHNAVAFYQKLGYTICGTWVLPFEQMKEEYRGMIILSKTL